jgi:hypothetical protein
LCRSQTNILWISRQLWKISTFKLWVENDFFQNDVILDKGFLDFFSRNMFPENCLFIMKNCFFQVVHDHYVRYAEQEMVEFVWARCKICTKNFAEVRVLDETPQHAFKRLLSMKDVVTSLMNRGLCCSLFKAHLEVRRNYMFFIVPCGKKLHSFLRKISFCDIWVPWKNYFLIP